MTYKAENGSRLSGDFVAAGDGLVAFGAEPILAVQAHYWVIVRACQHLLSASLQAPARELPRHKAGATHLPVGNPRWGADGLAFHAGGLTADCATAAAGQSSGLW
jgi:hypothetical protein